VCGVQQVGDLNLGERRIRLAKHEQADRKRCTFASHCIIREQDLSVVIQAFHKHHNAENNL
jgi:hypothetical protein